jgi:hypothetical protein
MGFGEIILQRNRKFVKAINSSGQELYFPMKMQMDEIENYYDNVIYLTDIKHTTFTSLKYSSSDLINIFGIPNFKIVDFLGKKMLEWEFKIPFENKKVSEEFQSGVCIISTSKNINKNDHVAELLDTIKNLNLNSDSNCYGHKYEMEYIPLDSASKWVLEIHFNKYPYESNDKIAIYNQSKKIIDFIERSINKNVNKDLNNEMSKLHIE